MTRVRQGRMLYVMAAARTPYRRTIRPLLAVGAATLVAMAAAGFVLSTWLRPYLRDRFIEVLREHYASDVALESLDISLFPDIELAGTGLTLRHRGRTDVPPLIRIGKITIHAGFFGVLKKPYRPRTVRVEGLQINVPPPPHNGQPEQPRLSGRSRIPDFLIGEVIADGTQLIILTSKPGKEPLTFDILKLRLYSAGTNKPMKFRAILTNPTPPGLIQSEGSFGPWDRDEPSQTPVAGTYAFKNADLSVFRGIAGILSSEGQYSGVLDHIAVEGTTDTPDFRVNISGHPVHLETRFSVVVDGTDGDTYLDPVTAHFLHTTLEARGKAEGTPGVRGKTIALDVTVREGRVEDLMRLAARGKPPMTGAVSLQTRLVLPPGAEDIADRLYLNGIFGLRGTQFTSPDVQQKIGALSKRAQGRPKEADEPVTEDVASRFRGRFVLKKSIVSFSRLSFHVPGATVNLDGTYGLRSEQLDFRGKVRMQAKLSQTQTGIKSFFLKALDPFFTKEGVGAVLPIKITGTRDQPRFGLNLRGSEDTARKEQ